MARQFAARGRNLALCARRADRLHALRDELLAEHPGLRIGVRALDVNDHAQVFESIQQLRDELGGLDRVIVNAGIGKGRPIGTGRFGVNLQTASTNFTAALAQCEAAVEIFRQQRAGHLVVISSMSAMRGLPRNLTIYAASKAGVSALAEGIRAELLDTRIPAKIGRTRSRRPATPAPPRPCRSPKSPREEVSWSYGWISQSDTTSSSSEKYSDLSGSPNWAVPSRRTPLSAWRPTTRRTPKRYASLYSVRRSGHQQ
jgi:hypothetical protein